MADLTFQSQQMAAEQSNVAGQATMQGAAALGAGMERGAQAIQQQANINTERGDRQQQWQEQRQDSQRQQQQNADLQGRALSLQERGLDQRAGMYEQELKQRREEFALAKVREERLAQIDAAKMELTRIELEQRKMEHEALKAIGEDKMQQQMIQSQELDLRAKAANVAMLERQASGAPSPDALFSFLNDPDNQLRWGMRLDVNGKPQSLSEDERSRLQTSIGRREVNRILETLVKSTADVDPAMSGKFAVIGMKVAAGQMSVDEAEQAINEMEQQQIAASGIDGAAVKPKEPAKDSGPFSGRFLGSNNAAKVQTYVKSNIPQFKMLLSGGADPRRLEGTDFSDQAIERRIAEIINNPRHPKHGIIIQGLAAEGLVDQEAYAIGLQGFEHQEAFETRAYGPPRMH